MKKISILSGVMIAMFLIGCGSQQESAKSVLEKQENVALFKEAQMNGCIECHRVNATVVGPSWIEIAKRYKDIPRKKARSLLIYSIKKGSRGKFATWKGGNGMPALENRVGHETIVRMVDYILKLNN